MLVLYNQSLERGVAICLVATHGPVADITGNEDALAHASLPLGE